MKNRFYPTVPDAELEPDPDAVYEPSRNRMREWAREYVELADELAKDKYQVLPDPPFDETLREAILDSRRFLKDARSRQLRLVAAMLRIAGSVEELRDALAGRTPAILAKQALEKRSEAWRARLMAEQDAALAEFLSAYPAGDRQRLRQLVRQAEIAAPGEPPVKGRAKRAATELMREIRSILEAAAQAEREPKDRSVDPELEAAELPELEAAEPPELLATEPELPTEPETPACEPAEPDPPPSE